MRAPVLQLAPPERATRADLRTCPRADPHHGPERLRRCLARRTPLHGVQHLSFRTRDGDAGGGRHRAAKAVAVVLAAWTDERLDFQGKYWSFEGVEIPPKSMQRPAPPTWVAATSPSAMEWAASQGHTIMMDPHSPRREIAHERELCHREGASATGLSRSSTVSDQSPAMDTSRSLRAPKATPWLTKRGGPPGPRFLARGVSRGLRTERHRGGPRRVRFRQRRALANPCRARPGFAVETHRRTRR